MNWDDLVRAGAVSCGGQIDFKNTNIGFLTADGPILTPDGEALVRSALVVPVVVDPVPEPVTIAATGTVRIERKARAKRVDNATSAQTE